MYRKISFTKLAIFFAVVYLFGASVAVIEYNDRLPKPGDRLVEGRIIKIEVEKTVADGFRSGHIVSYDTFLTIQIVNTDTVVNTILEGDWTNKLPDTVTFYYSGDPTKRVFLQGDTSLVRGLVLFGVMTAAVILGLFLMAMLEKRAERQRRDQHKALLEKIKHF